MKKSTNWEISIPESVHISIYYSTLEFQLTPYNSSENESLSITLSEDQVRKLSRQLQERVDKIDNDALEKAKEAWQEVLQEKKEV